jgi:hypothetical protein
LQELNLINELDRILINVNWHNLGLKKHVINSVKNVLQSYFNVIVIEDDVRISHQFLDFMQHYLSLNLEGVAHFSGFSPLSINLVRENLHHVYESRYISSYAWATSKKYFDEFDGKLYVKDSLLTIWKTKKFLVVYEKIIWSIYILAAHYKIVDSWAIPWTLFLWRKGFTCLSPTCNLVEYKLDQMGTHSKLKNRYIPEKSCQESHSWEATKFITSYDAEISRIVYRSDLFGVLVTIASVLYRFLKKIFNV